MAIQIGAKPESDFSNPLGLLSDCHRRIERFLRQLIAVAEEARGGELDDEARQALDVALRYFEKAAPLHTADEEASLFPRLRAVGGEAVEAALAAVDRLEAEHREADLSHAEADRLGRAWLREGRISVAAADRLIEVLTGLRDTYAAHIAVEDDQVFPLAGRVLPACQVRELGREMAERRGIDPDNPPAISRCAARRLERAD